MPRVDVQEVRAFTETLLLAVDTPSEIAEIVTDSLVNADIRGHSSHGVRQLGVKYFREIDEGKINPTNFPEIANEGSTWAQIDGNHAFGHAAGQLAIETAISKAQKHTIGLVGLNNVSHIGRVGHFAEKACDAGMAFVGFVSNPGSAWVAPPGSTQRRFSTNPISVGVPTFDGLPFHFIADVSTSQVAHGKIKEYAAHDQPLPVGWVVGKSGEPVYDAAAFEYEGEGAILPLGGQTSGYKGFGLSVLVELLTGNLSDGSVSGMEDVVFGNHVMFTTLDLSKFSSPDQIASRAAALADYVRSTRYESEINIGTAAYGDETLLPGEPEYRSIARIRNDGIPFSVEDSRNLVALANEHGVEEYLIPTPLLKE